MVGYLAISYRIVRGLVLTKQLRSNPLGLATASIFFTCALGHGLHFEHLVPSVLAGESDAMVGAVDWHLVAADVVTALIAFWHWSLRKHYGAMLAAGQLYDDVKARQRQALEINDNVVQGLATAGYALEVGDTALAADAIDTTLASARELIAQLLGERAPVAPLGPGDLIRERPAVVST